MRDDFVNAHEDYINADYEIVDDEIDEENDDYVISLDIDQIDDDLDSTLVWIGDNGSCYHKNGNCASLVNMRKVTISEAESIGKRKCKRCCK